MKTEKQVRDRLKLMKAQLKETELEFEKYDNYDDMELIEEIKAIIDELKWVLGEK